MRGRNECGGWTFQRKVALWLVLIFPVFTRATQEARAEGPPEPVRLGMVQSLVKNVPEPLVKATLQPFRLLMQGQTGYSCEINHPTEASKLADQIANKEIELGVFQGIEFAWASQKHPELRALVVAVNVRPNRVAHLIIRSDDPAEKVADLKGKKLAIPRQSRDHCQLFIDHRCRECGRTACQFFSHVDTRINAEEALDGIFEETIQAAAVDDVAWECYRRRKPGRAEHLKDFLKSEPFPDTAVVYRADYLDEPTLERFRQALLHADQIALGRQLLTLWSMTEFKKVPKDYMKMVKEIRKTYPPPDEHAKLPTTHSD
jgi:ABC-type phosphate/phosphonate transport system substrate-binding protein